MPMDVNLLRQIMQQRAGLPPEGGQGGGAPAQSGSPAPSGPPPSSIPAGTMSEQPMAQLQKSQPSEAMLIIKGLVNRLRSLPGGVPSGQSNSS